LGGGAITTPGASARDYTLGRAREAWDIPRRIKLTEKEKRIGRKM
jgi:hypothetical protein